MRRRGLKRGAVGLLLALSAPGHAQRAVDRAPSWEVRADFLGTPVSYTHLTLPTKA